MSFFPAGKETTIPGVAGVVIGIVTDNEDPEKLGRVKVKFPWLHESDESTWARVSSPMAGKERGIYFLPEVNDEVLVTFAHGNFQMPYVIGSLWNGEDAPPATNDDGKNNIRIIKSRSGHIISIDDTDGEEKIEIIDKTEKNMITIDSKENKITISSDKDIEFKAPNGKIIIDSQEVEIKSSAAMKIESGADLDLSATGNANVQGSMINLN